MDYSSEIEHLVYILDKLPNDQLFSLHLPNFNIKDVSGEDNRHQALQALTTLWEKFSTLKTVDNLAIHFVLAAYLVSITPHFVLGNFPVAMVCLVLTLWRIHLTLSDSQKLSGTTASVIGVFTTLVFSFSRPRQVGPCWLLPH